MHAAAAVRRAAQLAEQHRASLSLVHVVEPPRLTSLQAWGDSAEGRSKVASAKAELGARSRQLNHSGTRLSKQVLVGPVIEEILRVANEADLLVLGSCGVNPVKSVLLGSTATRLLTLCDRPILVVKQDKLDAYSRVLVPIDLEDDAAITLQAAQTFAPGAELHVLHAYRVEHEGMLLRAGVTKATLQRSRRDAKGKAQSRLHDALARAERGTHRFLSHLRRDHPVRLTLETETRLGADLIVMSKRSRSKVEDALLGSTTKRVVIDSICDVLVIPLLTSN